MSVVPKASRLFQPLQLGSIGRLQHRVVLAPLTRNRASEPSLSPSALTVQYYRQRASPGGLLITEATHISPESLAYPSTPGIWTALQKEGWQQVTDAVHQEGGLVVCQLWHTGRVAHPDFGSHPLCGDATRKPCVSASPTPIVNHKGKRGKTMTYGGVKEHGLPRELSTDDIARLRQDYKTAAQNAKDAGFDGVELHSAHGYLLDQFLNNGVNQRTDAYGGSVENRCRLLKEVLESILSVWPADKVGVRLSPHDAPNGGNTYYGCSDSNPDEVYSRAIELLDSYHLAYLLMTEPRWVGKHDANHETDPGYAMPLMNLQKYRSLYKGTLIGAGGFTPATSYEASHMEDGYDALAFGRWFISNPDFPERLRAWHDYEANGRSDSQPYPPFLNRYERDTFYTHGAEGYIDYPSLEFETNSDKKLATFEGMELNKYELVDPAHVGTSLKATQTDHQQSKL